MKTITIAGKKIGANEPCFIIAEAGVNHNGSLEIARALIDMAAEAGADAVKFQTFRAEDLVTLKAPKAQYQREATRRDESQYEMLKKSELTQEMHWQLKKYCEKLRILFLSTPFEEQSLNQLVRLGVPALKISSGEITNLPFLCEAAAKKIPIILSTGMSTLREVETAVKTLRKAGQSNVVLLHCVSNYPARPEDANLRAMHTMREKFKLPVGYSDHTMGLDVALAAVALGACVIEKHITLDRNLPGPDHCASLEGNELSELVRSIRNVEKALGHGIKKPVTSERETAAVARKSVVASRDIQAGATIRRNMLSIKRPGTGLPPALLEKVINRKARRTIQAGDVLQWNLIK